MTKPTKVRVSVTLTRPYLEAVDRLVEEGIYRGRGEVVMEALRDLLRKQGIDLRALPGDEQDRVAAQAKRRFIR